MTPEQQRPQRPYEIYGINEEEVSRWRISEEKFQEILANPNTTIHSITIDENNYGEFLFLTTSRGVGQKRTCMTFWGLGFHEYRERWIHQEWFWHQTPSSLVDQLEKLSLEEAQAQLKVRLDEISAYLIEDIQSEQGKLFEDLADMTDDDVALAEMQDLGLL